ncbi:T9SS type A sorting domain-containing protein, partial [bacterium]|nr:T9SS type A sorting domain-containing protein [bacterium]
QGFAFLMILSFALQAAFAHDIPKDALQAYELLREFNGSKEAAWRTTHLDADSVHAYDVLDMNLDLSIESEPTPLSGLAQLTIYILEYQDTLWLNAESLTIDDVTTSHGERTYVHWANWLGIAGPWQPGDTVDFSITYSAPVVDDHNEIGFHYGWNIAYTFSEPYGARKWFPCYDEPFDKVEQTRIAVEMPEGWHLASNGRLDSTTYPAPGRVREAYGNDEPICTYLMSIAAAPYARWYDDLPSGGQVRYFAFRQDSAAAVFDWARTPQMISLFETLFGPYPFLDYGMAEADVFYGWGAMEHQTFTTMGYRLVDSNRTYEGIVAHELAHQWFGDALSPVDFRHMWLNEGFASYGDALWREYSEDSLALQDFLNTIADAYFTEDQRLRYPIYNPPEGYLFGTAVYYKGAWVLHMLREQILGDAGFFDVMQTYVNRFLYGHVETSDFKDVCEEVAGANLDWFFNQWIYQAGFPVLNVNFTLIGEYQIDIDVTQLQTNAPLFRFPLTFYVTLEDGTVYITRWFELQQDTYHVTMPERIEGVGLIPFQSLLYQGTGADVPRDDIAVPMEMSLGQNWPNPFNSTTTFPLNLNKASTVDIALYNLLGQRIATIAHTLYQPGTHEIPFEAPASLATGIYFATAKAGDMTITRRVLFLK